MKRSITLVGNGNMAFAIASGLISSYDLEVVGRDMNKLNDFETRLKTNIKKTLYKDFNAQDKTLILCVKPANITSMKELIKGRAKTLYSVLAGTGIEILKANIDAQNYVRSMPNLAANIKKSMTTLTGDTACKDEALDIFGSIGYTLWVSSEKELNIATAVAGSGPAYLALIAEALADGGVKQGLKRDDAMKLMRGLFAGFADLVQDVHPAVFKDAVMSPGGTTAAGYSALEENGVRNGCIKAVEAAYKRATEL
ncbi:pyrroline-5-carboxylate reductase [Sulfurimonas sp. HSL-1716]|uniref:pyrroline-5-carboxylate reductase n=1 Tax=Hydrocurvibacter sulfurireducens TaxID=3131937 RepID=UPI0031F75509